MPAPVPLKLRPVQILLLGLVCGAGLATFLIVQNMILALISRVPTDAASLGENVLDILVALLLVGLIEVRLMGRSAAWQENKWWIALAAAVGLALTAGYDLGVQEGLLRFATLLPIACFAVYASGQLFARSEKDRTH